MGCCFSTQSRHATPSYSLRETSDQNTYETYASVHEINALKKEVVAVRTHLDRAPADFVGWQALSQLQQQAAQLDQDLQAHRQKREPFQVKDYRDRLDAINANFLALGRSPSSTSFRFDTTIRVDDREESARFFGNPL